MLQTPQVLILIRLPKSPCYYLSSHITEEKSRKKWREDNRKDSLIYSTINSPPSRITFHGLEAFNAVNFPVFSFSTLNKLIAVTFPHRHFFFQSCAIIFGCWTSSHTFCSLCDSEALQVGHNILIMACKTGADFAGDLLLDDNTMSLCGLIQEKEGS